MTDKDGPSRVAFGGNGNGGRYPRNADHSGNGADGSGITADQASSFPNQSTEAGVLAWRILDHLDRGVIAVDIHRTILAANEDARQVLRAGELLRVHQGRCEFVVESLDAQFAKLLTTLSLTSHAAQGFVARLSDTSRRRSFRVLVTSLSYGISTAHVAVLVYIFDTHGKRVISHKVLRELYGLTSAQAAVTAHLFEGHGVDATARLLGISLNTVRSHLKNVFSKCDVQSQVELMQLLDGGPHSI